MARWGFPLSNYYLRTPKPQIMEPMLMFRVYFNHSFPIDNTGDDDDEKHLICTVRCGSYPYHVFVVVVLTLKRLKYSGQTPKKLELNMS